MNEMDVAYRRDENDRRRMQEMAFTLEEFLRDPPSRCYVTTLLGLDVAAKELRSSCAHVVQVWD